jgi:hypothetical protein
MKNPIICLILLLTLLVGFREAQSYPASIMDDSTTLWVLYPANFWPSNQLDPHFIAAVRAVQNNGGGGGFFLNSATINWSTVGGSNYAIVPAMTFDVYNAAFSATNCARRRCVGAIVLFPDCVCKSDRVVELAYK